MQIKAFVLRSVKEYVLKNAEEPEGNARQSEQNAKEHIGTPRNAKEFCFQEYFKILMRLQGQFLNVQFIQVEADLLFIIDLNFPQFLLESF